MDRPSETDDYTGEEESPSKLELSHLSPVEKFFYIMNQSFSSVDPDGTGSILIEGLIQVLKQPSLGEKWIHTQIFQRLLWLLWDISQYIPYSLASAVLSICLSVEAS